MRSKSVNRCGSSYSSDSHVNSMCRRPWQRRIEVYCLKIQRCLTLFSRDAHDVWLLLEADPEVRSFCEQPAYVAGEAGRLIDFWVDRGRHAKFWILSGAEPEAGSLQSTLHGIGVRVLHRADMIAAEMRGKNWPQILPYLISFARDTNRRLQEEIFARLEKPDRLEHLEAAFQPIDVSPDTRRHIFAMWTKRIGRSATAQRLRNTPWDYICNRRGNYRNGGIMHRAQSGASNQHEADKHRIEL
jgi:hypothetical protein